MLRMTVLIASCAPRQLMRLWQAAPAACRLGAFSKGHGRGRSSRLERRRNGRCCGSSGGKRRPEPHGHGSLRPSFSTSPVSVPMTRSPRLTLDSLEGTSGGAC